MTCKRNHWRTRKANLTPFGHTFYDILEDRGIDTSSQEKIAGAVISRGLMDYIPAGTYKEGVQQQYISNWLSYKKDGSIRRPRREFWAWAREELHLTDEEFERLSLAHATDVYEPEAD